MPLGEVDQPGRHLVGSQGAALAGQRIGAGSGVVDLGGGDVEGDGQLLTGHVAGGLDGLHENPHAVLVRAQVGGEAALVAHRGGQAPVGQQPGQGVVGLDPPAQSLGEGSGADGHQHELLHVEVVGRMGATVEHVEHGHGQDVGVGPADVAVQRQVELVGRGPGHGQGHAEDGVGAQTALVVRAVEGHELSVDAPLIEGFPAFEEVGYLAVHCVDRPGDPLAGPLRPAVAKLHRLVGAGALARRDAGPAPGPAFERDLHLDCREAPGIKDLPARHPFDTAHCCSCCWWGQS